MRDEVGSMTEDPIEENPPSRNLPCVFYPSMTCPVRETIEQETLSDKVKPLAKTKSAMMAVDMSGGSFSKFMVLAPFCGICPYKRSEDKKHFR